MFRVTRVALALVVLCAPALPLTAVAADLETAKQNFNTFCTKCHGKEGKGDGPGAATLSTKPKDFTDCARMKAISDDTLFTAIKEGGEAVHLSKDMPAWKQGMEDDEIHDLVTFVRNICKP
jgi:cytochrome c oxidase cbb3-type subunit 3